MAGLNVNRVVNVTFTISPRAAGYRNFGAVLALGPSNVIDTTERIREYNDFESVVADFGINTPEASAAQAHFAQVPQPDLLYVGRWAQGATNGLLRGGFLTGAQLALSNFNAITTGSMAVTIDGTPRVLSGLNFTGVTNFNGVASIIQAALIAAGATGASVTWDTTRFTIQSGTAGTASTVSYGTPTGTGTDVTAPLGIRAGRASVPVNGVPAESLVQAVATLADVSGDWYVVAPAVADPSTISVVNHLAAAQLVESMSMRRLYAATVNDRAVLDATRSDDLSAQAKLLNLGRTLTHFSSGSAYAVFSLMGRFATVNYDASNSVITAKFKQLPGIQAETLTATQASALETKNCNVYVNYNNGTAIVEQGVMANGYYIDEVVGGDALVNKVQVDVYNLFYQSTTKIPQTDAGVNQIVNTVNGAMVWGVNNGYIAPGVWNADGFGALLRGQLLPTGFYVFAGPVNLQAQANRDKRQAPPIQVAAKLAGAIHSTDIAITVNR